MDGYGALFSEASAEEADVIVIPADLRIDYAEAWQLAADDIDSTGKMGFGHEDSIFNEIQVLGVTAPIWGDVMVLRAGEEPFGDTDFQSALLGAMDALERTATPAPSGKAAATLASLPPAAATTTTFGTGPCSAPGTDTGHIQKTGVRNHPYSRF